MIPQSRRQFTAPTELRARKAPSPTLAPYCLSGKDIMSLAAKGCYPPAESAKRDKKAKKRTYAERAEYHKAYMKNRRAEQKQEKGMM